MKKMKSQVTMLMIVGLVILITISLVLYLFKSTVKKQDQQTIKNSQEASLDSQSIKSLVTNCISNLAKDAVVLLGKQGGYIYQSQGGTLADYDDTFEGIFFLRYGNNKVSYNVYPIPRAFESGIYSAKIPDYPWQTFPYETESGGQELFEGPVFGFSVMPQLYFDQAPHSIEAQLEAFIDNKIQSCVNIGLFETQGYEVEISGSKTEVTIGRSDVGINSEIPLMVTNMATKQTFKFNTFSTRLDIRLGGIYSYVKGLIDKDTTNIAFNISRAQNNIDLIIVTKIELENLRDDLIKIIDEKSLVNGRPYEYIFARKNRNPALHYRIQNNFDFEAGHIITGEELLAGIQLKAEDPDEDSLEFKIYQSELGETEAEFPITLDYPDITFRIEVSDGELSDYQLVTVDRI